MSPQSLACRWPGGMRRTARLSQGLSEKCRELHPRPSSRVLRSDRRVTFQLKLKTFTSSDGSLYHSRKNSLEECRVRWLRCLGSLHVWGCPGGLEAGGVLLVTATKAGGAGGLCTGIPLKARVLTSARPGRLCFCLAGS